MTSKIDHHSVDIVLKLYDLRREPVMRAARKNLMEQFWPNSVKEVLAVMDFTHPLNESFRQVSSYWEMVYGIAKNGAITADYLAESNGEGLFLYAKIQPFLAELRKEYSPFAFANAEWIVNNSGEAKKRFELMKGRIPQMMEKMRGK